MATFLVQPPNYSTPVELAARFIASMLIGNFSYEASRNVLAKVEQIVSTHEYQAEQQKQQPSEPAKRSTWASDIQASDGVAM